MSVSVEVASLRAALRRELVRLHARAFQGGPYDVIRDGELLAFRDAEYVVDSGTIAALVTLPDGCGPVVVWQAIMEASDATG